MEKKNKINMLSPEEMQQEQARNDNSQAHWDPDWDSGFQRPKNPTAACEQKMAGDHCEWVDETGWIHYGLCKWDLNPPRAHLYCDEPGGSGTDGESGTL